MAIGSIIWQQHALINRLQSLLLLGLMAAFLALLGWLLWGAEGLIVLLISGGFLALFNPAYKPQLLMRLYGARPLDPGEAPQLSLAVEALAYRAGLPVSPRLYYLPSRVINAFATGRQDDAVIVLSDGLFNALNRRELIAVLAHEVSHIRANDTWVMGIADLFSRLTSTLSLFGQILLVINLPLILLAQVQINWLAILVLIGAPTVSALAQLGLSRTREYDADLNAVHLCADPAALASALVKIDRYSGPFIEQVLLPGRGVPEPSWLRTHPPTGERVRRILAFQDPDAVPLFEQLQAAWQTPFQHAGLAMPKWHLTGLWH